jgi:rRNA pseudouridine-1189 N-methylase Emg1 (Nep1/Mra1 family)
MDRNRSEGWTHAKKSGHKNEELIKNKIETDVTCRENLSVRLDKSGISISNVDIGGIKEKSVSCIIGGLTKSKTDLKIKWEDSLTSNISLTSSLFQSKKIESLYIGV